MSRRVAVEIDLLFGAIDECALWVNHALVVDRPPTATSAVSWTGKIPSAKTPLTIEASGVGSARYRVFIAINGKVATDIDRQLVVGSDIYIVSL